MSNVPVTRAEFFLGCLQVFCLCPSHCSSPSSSSSSHMHTRCYTQKQLFTESFLLFTKENVRLSFSASRSGPEGSSLRRSGSRSLTAVPSLCAAQAAWRPVSSLHSALRLEAPGNLTFIGASPHPVQCLTHYRSLSDSRISRGNLRVHFNQ